MRTSQGSILQSLRTVQSFLEANDSQLGDVNKTGARQELDAAIVELTDHVATQTGSNLASMGLTQRQYSLRQALLRDHMAPISRIAQAKLPPTPEVAPLRMPVGHPTIERLASLATGMAKAAEPYTTVFVAAGMPADFIAQLNAAAAAMVGAMSDRTQSRGSRRGATSGLKTTLASGRKIVHVLDAFVKSALKDNPNLLANWNLVKRVRIIPTRPAPGTTPPTTTPATPPAPTTPPSAPAAPTPAAEPPTQGS
jgi:hypothetical protein